MDDRDRLLGGLDDTTTSLLDTAAHAASTGSSGASAAATAAASAVNSLAEGVVAELAAADELSSGMHAVHGVHEQLHRHHMHMPNTGRRGSGKGLIWLLVLLHLGFAGYWIYVYFKQARMRSSQMSKKEPEKVNCVYEFALPTLALGGLGSKQAEKMAQH